MTTIGERRSSGPVPENKGEEDGGEERRRHSSGNKQTETDPIKDFKGLLRYSRKELGARL